MSGQAFQRDDPDFFGGGTWCYYPDSLLIRMPLTPDELGRVAFPDLTKLPSGLTNRELHATTSDHSKFVFARYQHELDHLMRLLSTSLGLFLHQLDSQLPDQFRWIASQTETSRFSEPLPLVREEDLSDAELMSTATERHAAVRLWHNTASLTRGLRDSIHSESQFVAAMTQLNWFREGQDSIEIDAAWPPNPAFISGTPATITGRNIIEFLAVLSEMDYCSLIAGDNQTWMDMLQDANYHAVMVLWGSAFPQGNLWDIDRTSRLESDFRLNVRLAYPLELYACLDLALWPPLTPAGVFASRSRYSWKDIHPGYRFVRLCEWLQDARLPLTRIGGEDRNDRFRKFQDLACETFGWPTVDELSIIWREDNRRKQAGEARDVSRLMSISLESASHPRLSMIDRLLQTRSEKPCDIVLGNIPGIDLNTHALGFVTLNEAGLLVIGDSPVGGWDIPPSVLRSVIMTGRFLLRGKDRIGGDHPSHFQSDIAESALHLYNRLLGEKGNLFTSWAENFLNH